jgi:hypothetical protein
MIAVNPTRCCNFALYRFVSAARGERRSRLSSDQAGRGGLSSSRCGGFLSLFKQSFASVKVVSVSSVCTRRPPAWALNRPPVVNC